MINGGSHPRVYTQSDAFQEILEWAKKRPSWQRDALRRLVSQGILSPTDLDELEEICLNPESEFDPISNNHIRSENSFDKPVSLVAIDNPLGINALALDQSLTFSPSGLSIVYGDNGSGKSGYVRILKHACRSRDANTDILHDINSSAPPIQSATIRYQVGNESYKLDWSPSDTTHFELPSVSIFDARSANIHVQAENNVAFIPFPMEVMEELANACDELRNRIDRRISEIESRTPSSIRNHALADNSSAGSFLNSISHRSNLETLDLLVTLSDSDKRRLATLESDLAQDPKKVTAKLSNLKTRLCSQFHSLLKMVECASEDSCKAIEILRKKHHRAVQVSKVASESLFSSSPLPDIGGNVWRALWEAARKYSNQCAYPQKDFPSAEVGDLCVLCQQPLRQEAIQRRLTFEEFVRDTAKSDEENAKSALSKALESIQKHTQPRAFTLEFTSLIKNELENDELAEQVRRAILHSAMRIRALLRGGEISTRVAYHPKQEIENHIDELDKRIKQLSSGDSTPVREKLLDEFHGLKDRSRLVDLKADIVSEIRRRKQIDALKKAAKTTAKRIVTNKNKELSDKLVTDALRGRFAREVEKLKIGANPLELRKIRDKNAQSFFQVEFVGLRGRAVGEVLSEGEHRCVALAAFLAELVTSREYSGIVFDDPMSSLDHRHRKNVARRLVEEAAHRQVVIFTHDLSFLFEVKREAEGQEINLHYQNVHRRADRPGHVANELPMRAKTAPSMAHAIQKELKDAKGSFDTWSDTKRTIFCKGVIEQLREAWDRVIADFIQPVLGRFDNQIKGSSLYRLLDLTHEDVVLITTARARLSEELHAMAECHNPETVTHQELCDEVKEILKWIENMKTRPKTAKPKIIA